MRGYPKGQLSEAINRADQEQLSRTLPCLAFAKMLFKQKKNRSSAGYGFGCLWPVGVWTGKVLADAVVSS